MTENDLLAPERAASRCMALASHGEQPSPRMRSMPSAWRGEGQTSLRGRRQNSSAAQVSMLYVLSFRTQPDSRGPSPRMTPNFVARPRSSPRCHPGQARAETAAKGVRAQFPRATRDPESRAEHGSTSCGARLVVTSGARLSHDPRQPARFNVSWKRTSAGPARTVGGASMCRAIHRCAHDAAVTQEAARRPGSADTLTGWAKLERDRFAWKHFRLPCVRA